MRKEGVLRSHPLFVSFCYIYHGFFYIRFHKNNVLWHIGYPDFIGYNATTLRIWARRSSIDLSFFAICKL